jgi:outer membrane protein OmpA-like peptidoglycan-associated protein
MSMLSPTALWRIPRSAWVAWVVLAVLLMSACASAPSSPSRPSGVFGAPAPNASSTDPNATPRPAAPATTPATALATEQRFLEDWFRGTPVVIAAQPPVTLQLDVPLVNSFDAGKADIKPALNAVLDRVAQSLLRQSAARVTINAPADASANAALAQSRAQRMREALGSKGIAATRVTLSEAVRSGGPVQLRLTIPGAAAQPIARAPKTDATAAAANGGVKPVSTSKPATGWTEKKP